MKIIKIIRVFFIIVAAAGFFSSCVEKLENPNFDVTVDVIRINLPPLEYGGDSVIAYSAKFTFSGDPGNLVFYSGEQGAEYQYRNRYFQPVDSVVTLQFATNFSNGHIPNTLRVVASNDFKPVYEYGNNGVLNGTAYTAEGVAAATWTDITDRFVLPGNQLSTGAVTNEEADITDLIDHDRPLFIGFRFEADKSRDASLSLGQWAISNFYIRNYSKGGAFTFYVENVLTNAWKKIDLADNTDLRVASNTLTLNGNVFTNVPNEGLRPSMVIKTFLISTPYRPTHIPNDKGMTIKTLLENVSEFTYEYVAPTVESVHVAFVATNSLYGDNLQQVKELMISFPLDKEENLESE